MTPAAIAPAGIPSSDLPSGRGDPAELRYKVTVEVDDNGSTRLGSSVWSFTLREAAMPLASPFNAAFRGEAVAVDLGGGRILFALLNDENNEPGTVQMWPERLFEDLGAGFNDRVESLRRIAAHRGESRVLPRWRPAISSSTRPSGQYPMLVRFHRLDDPESVETVEPDSLDLAFGPGVKLKGITVQITDEELTTGIQERLRWLEFVGKSRATLIPNPPRRRVDALPIQLIGPSAFTTELYK